MERHFQSPTAIAARALLVAALLAGLSLVPASPSKADESFDIGTFDVQLNLRYEQVRNDAPAIREDARALTQRTAVGYLSPSWAGFSIRFRFEDVTAPAFEDDYRNLGAGALSNNVTGRPVIADPEITEALEAAIQYERTGTLKATVGRSTLNLAEQRFIGAVPWRQHWQTFDQARVEIDAVPRTRIVLAYLDRVHRIFGDSLDMGGTVAHVTVDTGKPGTATVYGFSLDYDEPAFRGLSTRTTGARLKGAHPLRDGLKIRWHGEYADQTDTADNPGEIDAEYTRLELAAQGKQFGGIIGQETLGGSPTEGAFSAPLSTLHKWNGFADLFLVTPATGLVDSHAKLTWKRGRLSTMVAYHQFEPDSSGGDYGDEVNALVRWKSSWGQLFAAKFASYAADGFGADRDIVWLWTTYRWDSAQR